MAYERKTRVAMARKGEAIPITNDDGEILDGSCPIGSRDDLFEAIKNLHQFEDKRSTKAHIMKRAAALDATDALPSSWVTAERRRRGRPAGSVSLTRERQERILGLIRNGVFDHVAADTVGVSPRTLRDWVARGEGRSNRPATPKLRAFAKAYRQAKAEARAIAESRAYREHLLKWLSHAAPTRDGLPGWTKDASGEGSASLPLQPEELKELIVGLGNDALYANPDAIVPECTNRRCRCPFHRLRTPEEAELLRAIAAKRRKIFGGAR